MTLLSFGVPFRHPLNPPSPLPRGTLICWSYPVPMSELMGTLERQTLARTARRPMGSRRSASRYAARSMLETRNQGKAGREGPRRLAKGTIPAVRGGRVPHKGGGRTPHACRSRQDSGGFIRFSSFKSENVQ